MNPTTRSSIPVDLEEEGPYTLHQQFQSAQYPGSLAAARMQVLQRASRYVNRMNPGHYCGNEWTENLRAARILIHGFELHLHEAFQLLRFEFNPRCSNPLSDHHLWTVILAGSSGTHPNGRGWLNTPGKQTRPLHPRRPDWMRERQELFFWIPEEESTRSIHGREWKAHDDLHSFLKALHTAYFQRPDGSTLATPPLREFPMLGSEISVALGMPVKRVKERFEGLMHHGVIHGKDLRHVPGIYSWVFVPGESF